MVGEVSLPRIFTMLLPPEFKFFTVVEIC